MREIKREEDDWRNAILAPLRTASTPMVPKPPDRRAKKNSRTSRLPFACCGRVALELEANAHGEEILVDIANHVPAAKPAEALPLALDAHGLGEVVA